MPTKYKAAVLAASVSAALLGAPSLAARPAPGLEGTYQVYRNEPAFGPGGTLRLGKRGRFSYTMPCFRGDVFSEHRVEGRYAVKDNWLVLGGARPVPRDGCTYIDKAYIVRDKGETLLIRDWALAIAAQDRSFPQAWRRGGEPRPYTRKLEEWLPAPYARHLKGISLSGKVIATGEPLSEQVFGSGNQVYTHMLVEIDLGEEDGIFPGLRLCGPDKRMQFVETVSARSAKIDWGGTVSPGTAVSLDCTR